MVRVPIMLVSGYTGSGKTTIINQIGIACKRPAVITYEPDNVTIVEHISDVRKMKGVHHHCSSLFIAKSIDEMLNIINILVEGQLFDYIIIELSGTVEPYSIASRLTKSKHEQFFLQSVLTVIDTQNFWFDFTSNTELLFNHDDGYEQLAVADVLLEQIEFCNTLILNKCSGISRESSDELKWVLRKLQREARIIETTTGEIPLQEVLDGNQLDISKLKISAGWIFELMQNQTRFQLVEEYGIGTFIYERDVPFHPERFEHWFQRFPPEIIRTKGVFWSTSNLETPLLLSQAGPSLTLEEGSHWHWVSRMSNCKANLNGPKTELVFIGFDLNREEIIKQLDTCLVTREEQQQASVNCQSLLDY